jgi:hypothetical protein
MKEQKKKSQPHKHRHPLSPRHRIREQQRPPPALAALPERACAVVKVARPGHRDRHSEGPQQIGAQGAAVQRAEQARGERAAGERQQGRGGEGEVPRGRRVVRGGAGEREWQWRQWGGGGSVVISDIDSAVINSVVINSVVINSAVINSAVINSAVINSVVINSAVINSVVINSVVINSAVINSVVINSVVINSVVINSVVINSVVINSVVINSAVINSAVINIAVINSVVINSDIGSINIGTVCMGVRECVCVRGRVSQCGCRCASSPKLGLGFDTLPLAIAPPLSLFRRSRRVFLAMHP